MTHAILLSIHPKWAQKIYSGEKTVEWRKTYPKIISEDTKVYLYETAPIKKVTGYIFLKFNSFESANYPFTRINFYDSDSKYLMIDNLERMGCVPIEHLKKYLNTSNGYGWRIAESKKFMEPKTLADFGLKRAPQSWQYVEVNNEKI